MRSFLESLRRQKSQSSPGASVATLRRGNFYCSQPRFWLILFNSSGLELCWLVFPSDFSLPRTTVAQILLESRGGYPDVDTDADPVTRTDPGASVLLSSARLSDLASFNRSHF